MMAKDMDIKRLVHFETSDGTVYDTFAKAQSHSRRIKAESDLQTFVHHETDPDPIIDGRELVEYLKRHAEPLSDILRRLK